jgi:cytochrome P450
MKTGRRFFLSGAAALLAGARGLRLEAQRHDPNAPVPPFPPPGGPNAGSEDVPLPPRADPKVQLKEEQKELRRDVERLLQMVKDLKEESDKTPETDILSLSLVKKAEDIEKLAHQIRDRIRAG